MSVAPHTLLSQPIRRLLLIGFVLVALIPVSLLGIRVYNVAWDNAWREINEKHRLLAVNLASPIHLYINDHRAMLGMLARMLGRTDDNPAGGETARQRLQTTIDYHRNFRLLALVGPDGHTRLLVGHPRTVKLDRVFETESCFVNTRRTGNWALSGIKPSPLSGEPALFMSQPVLNGRGKLIGVLLAELRIEPIEQLRQTIRFGEKGHSAIVDKFGKVVAHPNPQWIKEMHDLSGTSIVKMMLAGESGVTEFYSPFVKQQMVAGYAAVPEIGWGVMVPQPKIEVERQVRGLLFADLGWGVAGLALAAILAFLMARWITEPINRLAASANELVQNDSRGELPASSLHAPREISQLGTSFNTLVSSLQRSRSEVEELNRSLQSHVDAATERLRVANLQLEALARKDHLTSLPNRRHFENTLASCIGRRSTDTSPFCIMLIDVDNFKDINDRYGHAAGDAVLVQLAELLQGAMRENDMVARYGGDEFVAQMRCRIDIGRQRAWEILEAIRRYNFRWKGFPLPLTVSIGLLYCERTDIGDLEIMLRQVDNAMYEAKHKGRNTIVEHAA